MEEGDAPAVSARARRLVDEPVPGGMTPREGRVQVGDPQADVVDAGSAPGEEARDGSLGIDGLEQLELRATAGDGYHGRAIGRLGRRGCATEDVAVESKRVGDAGHRHADVGDGRTGNGRRWQHEDILTRSLSTWQGRTRWR
jgi:hypothetical protein